MEGSLLSRFEPSLVQETKHEASTRRYRQELGLLVSEFWPSGGQPSDDGRDNDTVKLVARHLQQQQPVKRKEASYGGGTSSDAYSSNRKRRHPGYIELQLLCQPNSSNRKDHNEEESKKGSAVAAASQRTLPSQKPIFVPTCGTCCSPLQPGAFGCSTRVASASKSTRQPPTKVSASQKRRQRRKRQQWHTNSAASKTQQQQQTAKPEFAKWYEHVQKNVYPSLSSNRKRGNKEGAVELEITCGTCQTRTTMAIPKRKAPAQLKVADRAPKAVVTTTTSAKQKQTPQSKSLEKKGGTSPGTKRSYAESSSASLEGDFISLKSDEKKKEENNSNMRSAVKPKKKKKKRSKGSSNLMDFLSSLNDR